MKKGKPTDLKNPCKRRVDEHWFDPSTGKDLCADMEPDWAGSCDVCGSAPVVPLTGMCGPCSFGEGETASGNW